MAAVSRVTGTSDRDEGFFVTTQSAGTQYAYDLRIREHPDDETGEPGTVELVRRTEDGEDTDLEVTNVVRDLMSERGFEVDA